MIRPVRSLVARLRSTCRAFARDASGVIFIEFAYSLPVLLGVGMYGAEMSNYAVTRMRIEQAALALADNGSRVGVGAIVAGVPVRQVFEQDLNDLFIGANLQAGNDIDLFEHGRVVMSQWEQADGPDGLPNTADDTQVIGWQRCFGEKPWQSLKGQTIPGEDGEPARDVPLEVYGQPMIIEDGEAAIIVEVNYTYQPIISDFFVRNTLIRAEAAFHVRDQRDLRQIFQTNPAAPVAACNQFSSDIDDLT